ncbi:MAG: transglutaminase family protein [Capsulimonadaceae bacterium]|nr:transglutaminase family protein [Capsulimonadaceae bacterium]
MRLKLQHVTRFTYPAAVHDNHNEVRLMPINDERQTCTDFWLATSPLAHVFFYNLPTGRVHHFNVRPEHTQLSITATSRVITQPGDPIADLPFGSPGLTFYDSDIIREDFAEYLMPTARVPEGLPLDEIIRIARAAVEGEDTPSFVLSLNRVLHRILSYRKGATDVDTPLNEVIDTREGVCQDFAHLMLAICRRLGIPARYMSGYLHTAGSTRQGLDHLGGDAESELKQLGLIRPASEGLEMNTPHELVDGDAMHAWVECLLPDGRWHGFDPTNCIVVNDAYVRVHYGRDYGDVPPTRGVYAGPQAHKLEVSVTITEDAG